MRLLLLALLALLAAAQLADLGECESGARDCRGVCNGGASFDAAGTCCLPAKRDACGVCNGDGSSCCGPEGACHGRGTCSAEHGSCLCEPYYTSATCAVRLDACDYKTCANDAACAVDPTSGEAACVCAAGWIGDACDEPDCAGRGKWDRDAEACVCLHPYDPAEDCGACEPLPEGKAAVCVQVGPHVAHLTMDATKAAILSKLGWYSGLLGSHLPLWPAGTERDGVAYDCACQPADDAPAARASRNAPADLRQLGLMERQARVNAALTREHQSEAAANKLNNTQFGAYLALGVLSLVAIAIVFAIMLGTTRFFRRVDWTVKAE